MGNIFSTANNETLIIYPQNNIIYLLVTKSTTPCQATVLQEDFRSNFSAFLYKQTIYYTYINNRDEIVVKNIRDNATLFTLVAEDDSAPYKEVLAEAEGEIVSLKEMVAALQEENATLQQDNSALRKTITSMEQTIESAKEQYSALMDTATKYREEAQKWFLIAKKKRQ